MADHVICCVAENEAFDDPDGKYAACKSCGDLNVLQMTIEPVGETGYHAPVRLGAGPLGSGGIESWSFDGGPEIHAPVPLPEDADTLLIPYPAVGDWAHLCVRYNREGGARISVVGVDIDTMERIRPTNPNVEGTDARCPLAAVTLDGADYGVAPFDWDPAQMTILPQDVEDRGAFSHAPSSTNGEMVLTAKDRIELGGLKGYDFVSWERNLLSNWQEPAEHQWLSDTNQISFNKNGFWGVIAYYRFNDLAGDWTPPLTKPGPRVDGYPIPKVFRAAFGFIAKLLRLRIGR